MILPTSPPQVPLALPGCPTPGFSPRRVTDDLALLLQVLPLGVRQALAGPASQEELLEVVLDLGRIPEARYPGRALPLSDRPIERSDLAAVVDRLGPFAGDNRAGIERTLHRISAIRNRSGEVVGLTCRVGRAVHGTVEMVRDLLDSAQSMLLLGRPGVGKTTALREIARVLADDLGRRVVVIDTSNEIAGDGDIPHPAIGRARRMQVARPDLQHRVMIEAVENHMPEVIVIDEIGTEREAMAARTIAERGVQLVATAHGNALANLIRNPTLSDLVGGIQSVTLGDEEARRRGSRKTVLERCAEPTFPLAVEIHSRGRWLVHTDVARTVDALLRGQPTSPQARGLDAEGRLRLEAPLAPSAPEPRAPKGRAAGAGRPLLAPAPLPDPSLPPPHRQADHQAGRPVAHDRLALYCWGVSGPLLDQLVRSRRLDVQRVESVEQADAVLTLPRHLGRDPGMRRRAQQLRVPILVIKADTHAQILRGVERLLRRTRETSPALAGPLEIDEGRPAVGN